MKILSLFLTLFSISSASAADRWESYQSLLTKIATDRGVNWSQFGKGEKVLLAESLKGVAAEAPPPAAPQNDRLAFWVNSHNLCVLSLLSDHLPIEDVMKIQGFRDQLTCKIAGTDRSLSQIVSESIRPQFKEPRIHFALWWGTKGGPRLMNAPYRGATLDQQLAEQTKRELAGQSMVQIDKTTNRVSLSPLFDWFKVDFGKGNDAVLDFLRKNMPPEEAKLLPKQISRVSYKNFDWSLDRAGG